MLAHVTACKPTAPYLYLMNDPDDSRVAPTTPAPAPISEREPKTHPEASNPAGNSLAIPKAPGLPREQLRQEVKQGDSYFEAAARDFAASLVELKETRKAIEDGFRTQGEKIDQGNQENAQNYGMLREEFMRFRETVTTKDRDQDGRLDAVTKAVSALSARIDGIEKSPRPGVAYEDDLREVKQTLGTILDMIETMGSADKSVLAGRKVLLVDDLEILLRTLTRVLSSHGATVLTASTFATVKLLVRDFDPDCVVVDLRLAAGEDGAVVANWLLNDVGLAKSRVLLMTGDTGPGPRALAARLGVGLVEKPMASGEFVSAIREASNRPS
jgi:CheY-like chemotaxis protein